MLREKHYAELCVEKLGPKGIQLANGVDSYDKRTMEIQN